MAGIPGWGFTDMRFCFSKLSLLSEELSRFRIHPIIFTWFSLNTMRAISFACLGLLNIREDATICVIFLIVYYESPYVQRRKDVCIPLMALVQNMTWKSVISGCFEYG